MPHIIVRRKWLVITFFLSPALIIYALVMLFPLAKTLSQSFYRLNESNEVVFTGITNYVTLFGDAFISEQFINAFYNNALFFVVHMLVQNPIAILLAVLLSTRGLRGGGFYRAVIFIPAILSYVIAGYLWKTILGPSWGVSHSFLEFFGLESWFKPWLGLESTALITLALISVWQYVGIPTLLIYAALLSIPDEIIEAAKCDGLGTVSRFFNITLPIIAPTVLLVSILTFVINFNAFDLVYTVQGSLAGPDYSTDLIGTLLFRKFYGFQMQAADMHLGASIASVMFLFILVVFGICLLFIQRKMLRYCS